MAPPPRCTHYYVWYRIEGDAAQAHRTIDGVLRDVARRCGVKGRVLVRRDDARTWMEIYEDVVDAAAFETALLAAVRQHGAAGLAEGGKRHAEPFVAVT